MISNTPNAERMRSLWNELRGSLDNKAMVSTDAGRLPINNRRTTLQSGLPK